MKIPAPTDVLGGCVWLPRILAKARMLEAGSLSEDYASRFCHPSGLDGMFLDFFGLTREELVEASAMDDAGVVRWFISRDEGGQTTIEAWNEQAMNIGRAGYPLAERFPIAMATVYKHVAVLEPETVFEALIADETDT